MGLLEQPELTAQFKPGKSALGHRWLLYDGLGEQVGQTDREYSGGLLKRGLWRTVTATGMDSGNDIRAEVQDAGGQAIAHLFSRNEKQDPRVELTRPDGQAIGSVHHVRDEGFTYKDAGGGVVAKLPVPGKDSDPWSLLDDAGTQLGRVTRQKAVRDMGAGVTDYLLGVADAAEGGRDFQNTMHLGFAFSSTYSVVLTALPSAEPLRTLAVLTPVILGYAY